MYPLTVLRMAKGSGVTIELKNKDVYRGTLSKCDLWMNIFLRDAVLNGDKEVRECYIRGYSIRHVAIERKYLGMQEVLQRRKAPS